MLGNSKVNYLTLAFNQYTSEQYFYTILVRTLRTLSNTYLWITIARTVLSLNMKRYQLLKLNMELEYQSNRLFSQIIFAMKSIYIVT